MIWMLIWTRKKEAKNSVWFNDNPIELLMVESNRQTIFILTCVDWWYGEQYALSIARFTHLLAKRCLCRNKIGLIFQFFDRRCWRASHLGTLQWKFDCFNTDFWNEMRKIIQSFVIFYKLIGQFNSSMNPAQACLQNYIKFRTKTF